MSSLSQTLLLNLYSERNMAIHSGNKMRLEYLDREIMKLEGQIKAANKNEVKNPVGMV